MDYTYSFEIIEGITRADIALSIRGQAIESIFFGAAKALLAVMLEDPESAVPVEERAINLERENEELLLFSFLDELIFLKDAENLLLVPRDISVETGANGAALRCVAGADVIDRERHRFNVDVKAVTMHRLEIRRVGELWSALVVLDV